MTDRGSPCGSRGVAAWLARSAAEHHGTVALVVLAVAGTVRALAAVLAFRDVLASRHSTDERARVLAVANADNVALQIDSELEAFAGVVRDIAAGLTDGTLDRSSIGPALAAQLDAVDNANSFRLRTGWLSRARSLRAARRAA